MNLPSCISERDCIILIGMAGAGKTTVGSLLAKNLGWAFVDSDHIIEASYAVPLQKIADALGKEGFIDTEASIVSELRLSRTVIATGGSVIYRENTMRHLRTLGPIVYLDVSMGIVLQRIAQNPDRGLAVEKGQTLEELFLERESLYRRYADVSIKSDGLSPEESVDLVLQSLSELPVRNV